MLTPQLPPPLDPQVFADFQTKLQDVLTGLFGYQRNLSASEIRALVKIGPKMIAFVEKALAAAKANPDDTPRRFSVSDMENALLLFKQMQALDVLAEQISLILRNMGYVSGDVVRADASTIYHTFTEGQGENAALKVWVDEMAVYFEKTKGETPPPTPPTV